MALAKDRIPILEEFISIQGEGVNIGMPYGFIRVGGCPLRCNFCDTESSWVPKADSIKSVVDVTLNMVRRCRDSSVEWVSITGGEPLLYPDQVIAMIEMFTAAGIKTHIETSGRFYSQEIHEKCTLYSPDAKTPCTGESKPSFFQGIENMRSGDQVKCLIHTEHDLIYAHHLNKLLDGSCTMVLQPFNISVATDSTKHMTKEMADSRYTEKPSSNELRRNQCIGLQWLLETFKARCMHGERWVRTIITPQIHVLAFGNEPNR